MDVSSVECITILYLDHDEDILVEFDMAAAIKAGTAKEGECKFYQHAL